MAHKVNVVFEMDGISPMHAVHKVRRYLEDKGVPMEHDEELTNGQKEHHYGWIDIGTYVQEDLQQ